MINTNVKFENYAGVCGSNKEEVEMKIERLMKEGKITEVVKEPHCGSISGKGTWFAYVR